MYTHETGQAGAGLAFGGAFWYDCFTMQSNTHSEINELLEDLLSEIQKVLGDKLVGLYLYGSLAWGDFDYDLSDIDLLAALKLSVDDEEFNKLKNMHAGFVKKYPKWDNRIEVQYLSLAGLKTYKTESTKMVIISPGDPLHEVQVDMRWIMNWYFVQEHAITLFGPKPDTIIDPISKEEFIQAAKDHAMEWREYVKNTKDSRGYQGYAILTLCRALYTVTNGEHISKKQASIWAEKELPEWASLIQNAAAWREAKVKQGEKDIDPSLTYPETEKFVNFVIDLIEKL